MLITDFNLFLKKESENNAKIKKLKRIEFLIVVIAFIVICLFIALLITVYSY